VADRPASYPDPIEFREVMRLFGDTLIPIGTSDPLLELTARILLGAAALATAAHVLLHKRMPRSAAIWLALCLLIPVVGVPLYWLFGFNRISTSKQGLRDRGRPAVLPPRARSAERKPDPVSSSLEPPHSAVGQRVTGRPLVAGNQLQLLENGDAAYPRMLAAIRAAQSSVYCSTFIFDRDRVGSEFAEELGAAARRGVDVRVLVDGIGERYSLRRIGPLLERAGCRVARFLPPSLFPPSIHINLRYHRKLLIVDSTLAFTGGMNISGRHLVAQPIRSHPVRDLHFAIEGPAVAEIESVFREDWQFAAQESDGFPAQRSPTPIGSDSVRAIRTGPDEDFENLRWILVSAISEAHKQIRIMTPYFIAEASLVAVLNAASLRGVDVELMLPARNNLKYMTWAANSQLWQLLEFGVRIHSQHGPFNHTKLIVIDDRYALIGSANLDPRSLRLNFEFNLEVYGEDCVTNLVQYYEDALKESQPVTLEALEERPLWEKLRDALAALFSPYL
jgi:cardiolipin synthase